MAFARVEGSPRLRSALRALQAYDKRGITGLELCLQAGILNPGEVCSELRRNGYEITATEEAKSANGRRVFRYRIVSEPEQVGV